LHQAQKWRSIHGIDSGISSSGAILGHPGTRQAEKELTSMTMFEDRERAFEAKWAHDEEMQFRIVVRRNELLGRWAGVEQGLADEALERYVAELVALALKTNSIDALYLKVRADLGAAHSDAAILKKMDEFLDAAALNAGLEQRPAAGAGKSDAPSQSGGNVTHVDFTQVFSGGDSATPDQEGAMHVRMLRKISARSPD